MLLLMLWLGFNVLYWGLYYFSFASSVQNGMGVLLIDPNNTHKNLKVLNYYCYKTFTAEVRYLARGSCF